MHIISPHHRNDKFFDVPLVQPKSIAKVPQSFFLDLSRKSFPDKSDSSQLLQFIFSARSICFVYDFCELQEKVFDCVSR